MLYKQSYNIRLTAFSCICAVMLVSLGFSNQTSEQKREELEDDKRVMEEDLRHLETQVTSLVDSSFILNQQIEQQNKINEELESETHKLKNVIEEKENKIEKIEEQKENLKKENKTLKKENGLKHLSSTSSSSSTSKNGKKQTMNVTMFTAGYESTQKKKGHPLYGVTASGEMVQEGVTLACPPEIPFGTKITIEGFGTRVCHDRGSAITSGHLDIYTNDLAEAKRFGRQDLQVTIHGK